MADELEQKDTTVPIDDTAPVDLPENDTDDVVYDDENASTNPAQALKKLREKLKKAEAEKTEYLTGWQRSKADLINARKRDEEDRKNFIKYANEGLIEDLLPVLDSFSMAFANKEAWEKVDKNWRMGVEYIYSQLMSTLERNNITVIDPKGQTFDPNHHISMEMIATEDKTQDGKIMEVIQKGYELNGKVIRAPKVKVGEFKQ
jgi:molecular chaperone GrpE